MNREIADIELIRKYFNGELDKKTMHALEKRALDDPFLADAMDGFEEFLPNDNTLIELNERLKDRMKNRQLERSTSFFNFKNWSIAASVVLLIGLISIYLNMPKEENFTTDTVVPALTQTPLAQTPSSDSALAEQPPVDEKLKTIIESREIVSVAKPAPKTTENISPADIIVEKLEDTNTKTAKELSNEVTVVAFGQSKRAIENDNIALSKTAALSEISLKTIADTATLKGKVIDNATGMPLFGVVVTDKKTGKTALSDEKGEFILPEKSTSLSFYIPGYEPKELEIKNTSEKLNVVLRTPNIKTLQEKAPVYFGNTGRKTAAGPRDGWAAFKKYLNANSELESGETGHVIVEFVLLPNGELSDFKILKSLSKLADARAIDLIKNYQLWCGAPDGSTNRVKVTVRFN